MSTDDPKEDKPKSDEDAAIVGEPAPKAEDKPVDDAEGSEDEDESEDRDGDGDEEPADEPKPVPKPVPEPASGKPFPWTYLLLVANLLLVWGLPLIPAQDLPQHLTYIRIFADYDDPSLPFHDFYTLPQGFQPYDSVYLIVAFVARHSSVLFALRLTLSIYVLLVFVGYDVLSASIHGRPDAKKPMPTGVMASMIVWSSALSMGFFQYFLCVPLVMLTVAALVRGSEKKAPDWVVLAAVPAAAAVGSIHLVAAGALAVFAVLHALVWVRRPGFGQRLVMAGVVLGSILTALVLWRLWGGEVLGAHGRALHFDEAWRNAQGFEFVNNLLDATWYDPPVTFNYIVWGTLGPYRIMGLGVSLAAIIACLSQVIPIYESQDLRPEAWGYARTAWAFALFTCLIPWGIQVPSEITWLNFRLISLAFSLLLPLIPPRWFSIERSRSALIGLAVVYLGNFTVHAIGFNREAASATRLLEKVPNHETLLSLVYRGRSAFFAKGMRLTHFLPMYFTVLDGGIASQFWAKYTEHLPIDYRPGKRPAQPDDWSPQHFDENKHLKDVGYVILQRATKDDPNGTQSDAVKGEQKLAQKADLVECDGIWCLYKVRPKPPPAPLPAASPTQ
jgi:hypothetical protein